MKIDTMVDVFLNTANFAQHAFFTLAPPAILIIIKFGNRKIPFNNLSQCHRKVVRLRTMYSRVHISSDEVFSKILKKPSIVQKKMIPHMKGLDFSER